MAATLTTRSCLVGHSYDDVTLDSLRIRLSGFRLVASTPIRSKNNERICGPLVVNSPSVQAMHTALATIGSLLDGYNTGGTGRQTGTVLERQLNRIASRVRVSVGRCRCPVYPGSVAEVNGPASDRVVAASLTR